MNNKEWSKQTTKCLIIVCILMGFGSTYLIIDYRSIPSDETKMWEGEFSYDSDRTFSNPSKTFLIGLGDGFISNIEMIFIHLSLIFGIFTFADFIFLFEPKNENDVKPYFRKIIYKIKNKYSKKGKK